MLPFLKRQFQKLPKLFYARSLAEPVYKRNLEMSFIRLPRWRKVIGN